MFVLAWERFREVCHVCQPRDFATLSGTISKLAGQLGLVPGKPATLGKPGRPKVLPEKPVLPSVEEWLAEDDHHTTH